MADTLRYQIAKIAASASGDRAGNYLDEADAILTLPEIAAALKLLEAFNKMPPTEFVKLPVEIRRIVLECQAFTYFKEAV